MEIKKRKVFQNGHNLSIYIPAEIEKKLKIKKGDNVYIKVIGDEIIIKKKLG